MKPKLKLFGSSHIDEDFTHDLNCLLSIFPENSQFILQVYQNRKALFDSLNKKEIKQLTESTKLSEQTLKDIHRITRFLLRAIAIGNVTIDDINSDLSVIERNSEEIRQIQTFLESILIKHPNLKKDTRKIIVSNETIDTLKSVEFSIDVRAVYDNTDDSDVLIDIVPVLIIRMSLEGDEKENEFVYQLGMKSLNAFCEVLEKQKRKLEEVTKRIQLKE